MQYFIAYNICMQLYKHHFTALVLFIIAHIVFLLHSQYVFQLIYFSIISRSGSSRAILSPSANAGDHHSILSISIFTCRLFSSLSICRLKTGEAPARGSAHQKFDAPPTSGASLPVYTKSLNSSVLYTPFSSIFLKLSFTAATSS